MRIHTVRLMLQLIQGTAMSTSDHLQSGALRTKGEDKMDNEIQRLLFSLGIC